jgi:hypothetical protein
MPLSWEEWCKAYDEQQAVMLERAQLPWAHHLYGDVWWLEGVGVASACQLAFLQKADRAKQISTLKCYLPLSGCVNTLAISCVIA